LRGMSPELALGCRAGGADQSPKLRVERTQSGYAATAESDPKADLELIWQYSHEHLDELRWALGELAGVHFG
jgi:hypothetical protein